MVDTVAQCLSTAKEQLNKINAKYIITKTRPTRNLTDVDEECLYVIRQQIDTDGVYHLVAAAKMEKAKC